MLSYFKKFITLTAVTLFSSASLLAGDSIDYRPKIHGVVRTSMEVATEAGDYRFQVRNARLSVKGNIASTISYFINTDFCDQGKIKILDVWGRISLADGLALQAGQFRMPFGVESFRGPLNYIFANRAFIGKQMCNVRAVGIKACYEFPTIPLSIEAGAFNPTTIGDHSGWHNTMACAGKISYRIGNVTLTTGVQSIIPEAVRTNLIDACISWESGRWLIEGEYMNKHYTRSSHKTCHGYNLYADYRMPINAGIFNRLSFQGRLDGMTDHSNSRFNDEGTLSTDDPARNRISAGTTISHIKSKNLFLDLRANYEKYFFHKNADRTPYDGDKAVIEMVLRF